MKSLQFKVVIISNELNLLAILYQKLNMTISCMLFIYLKII